ncbi:MAG: LysR family transcriptional regulator [Bacteroidota bacterium]|nr:LysR family transcriptional regulator [Bacteroidota bacterium]
MNFTLHQLRIFSVVVEKKSITKASEELNMTQPAVSIQLKKLQDQFDIPLTELINRKLYITDFGKQLYQTAEKILKDVEAISYHTTSFKGLISGKLRISVVSTGKYVMPYYLRDFLKLNPTVDLNMDVTNRDKVLESLAKNEVDFSLVSVNPNDIVVEEEVLMQNKIYMIGPYHAALKTDKKLPKTVFETLPLIFREEGSATRLAMQQYFTKAGVAPAVKMELTSTEAVKQAVIAGLGYSVLSLHSIKNELKQKDVKIIPVVGMPLQSQWKLIWLKKKKFSVAAQAYLDYIRMNKQKIHDTFFSWMDQY